MNKLHLINLDRNCNTEICGYLKFKKVEFGSLEKNSEVQTGSFNEVEPYSQATTEDTPVAVFLCEVAKSDYHLR